MDRVAGHAEARLEVAHEGATVAARGRRRRGERHGHERYRTTTSAGAATLIGRWTDRQHLALTGR
jgi:hypothetical protein